MLKLSSEADQVCVAKAAEAGQGHVFDHWDELSAEAQKDLIRQLQAIDFQLLKHLIHQRSQGSTRTEAFQAAEDLVLRSPEVEALPCAATDPERWAECRQAGEEAIAAGKVGVVMVGEGSPQGCFGGPVGLLPIGPVTGKSIYQLHAEKVRALNLKYKVSLPWWIVTTPETHDEVREFFRAHNYFGLSGADLVFMPQPLLPLVDRRGRIVLGDSGRLAVEANGHGGVLLEFLRPQALEHLAAQGIEHLVFFQVDNPLVPIADPVFIGHHILHGNEVTSKAIEKVDPDEPVGVFCRIGGNVGVIEYSEISAEDRTQLDGDGKLVLRWGNMAHHVFSVEFFRRLCDDNIRLPSHQRHRAVPCIDKRGRRVRPTEPNCVAFRFYLFDSLRVAARASVVASARELEFSPIKTASGNLSPQAAQRALSRLYSGWLHRAGATFKHGLADDGLLAVEISPLFALDEDECRERIDLPLEINNDLYLD